MFDYNQFVAQELHSASQPDRFIKVRTLGLQDYLVTQSAMQSLAQLDKDQFSNQIWLLEHPAVYTQGTSCSQSTLLPSDIPVVKSDRGGQITYHGPGQLVMYPLLDLRVFGLGVKALVQALEETVIRVLSSYDIKGVRRDNAPGVYVDGAKIAALGLRVKNGHSYHGLSFNLSMDLTPFSNIDPCGFQGLKVTSLKHQLEQRANKADIQMDSLLDSILDSIGQQVAKTFVSLI